MDLFASVVVARFNSKPSAPAEAGESVRVRRAKLMERDRSM